MLNKFKQMEMILRKHGHRLEIVRSDCGTEILQQEVGDYMLQKGIKHEQSAPRCPEQNGYVERHMRTVTEAARSMIHAAGLSLKYWGEAVVYACAHPEQDCC